MRHPCRNEAQLSAYLDGELSRKQHQDLKKHLDECPECRRTMEALQRTDALIRDMPALEPSADFDRTFWKKVDADEKDGRRSFWRRFLFRGWRPVWAGALAGLAAVWIYINANDPLTPEEVYIAEHMEFLEDYDLIGQLEMLEHLDDTDALKEQT